MKKSLIIIPLVAMALVSCTSSSGGGKKKKSSSSGDISTSESSSSKSSTKSSSSKTSSFTTTKVVPPILGDETYEGYRRVMEKPQENKDYIYGVYSVKLDKYLFLNGHHHTDEKGEYPWYLSTTEDVTKAVKINFIYTDDTHFDIKIVGGGEFQTYDNCFLEIYNDDGHTSLRAVKTLSSEYTGWYFLDNYDDGYNSFDIKSNVIDFNGEVVNIGTHDTYESFEAIREIFIFKNFIGHIWEPLDQ